MMMILVMLEVPAVISLSFLCRWSAVCWDQGAGKPVVRRVIAGPQS